MATPVTGEHAQAAQGGKPGAKGLSWKRLLGYAISIVIVVAIFAWAIRSSPTTATS